MSAAPDLVLPGIFTVEGAELRQFDRDLMSSIGGWAAGIKAILDKGISVDDNLDAERVSVVTHVTPGTEFSVAHGLGKVPTGYIVHGQTAAGSIYDGASSNTKTALYLKSNVSAATFRIIVF